MITQDEYVKMIRQEAKGHTNPFLEIHVQQVLSLSPQTFASWIRTLVVRSRKNVTVI